MLTVVCKLAFPDGRQITGRIQAKTPGLQYEIAYAGAVEQLAGRPESGTPSDLELAFRMTAQRTGAILSVERSGDYESRTESIPRNRAG